MVHTILTHPGGAHKDDLLAVCILVAKLGAPIVRREPTQQELNDADVVVVDIGGIHDPNRMDFDHHQFPRENEPTCALSLVMQHFGIYEDAQRCCDWLEPAEWFDSRGPTKTADWLGVPRRAIAQLNSPIDMTLLRRFAQVETLAEPDPLYEFIRMVGEDLLEHLRVAQDRISSVANHAQRWSIPRGSEMIEAIFMPRTTCPADETSAAVSNYVRVMGLGQVISAIVYPDRRSTGYGISRYEDHPKLDFSRVGHEPDVHFAHATGFMCKTSTRDEGRLKELIVGAWRDE